EGDPTPPGPVLVRPSSGRRGGSGRRLRQRPRPRAAGRRGARQRHRVPRLHGRQRRPAEHRRRPRRVLRAAAVGRHRLHADPRGVHPHRRVARRPARPAPRVRVGHRGVRRDVAAVRDGADRRRARRRPCPPGRGGGAAHTRLARGHPGELPCRRPGARDRHVGGHRRHRPGAGSPAGRAARRGQLAPGVPRQPAGRSPRPRPHGPVRPREPRPAGRARDRPGRGRPRRRRPRRADGRPRRGRRRRGWGGAGHARRRGGGRRGAGRGGVRVVGATGHRSDGAAVAVGVADLHRRQPADARGLRRPQRAVLLPRPPAADLAGLPAHPGGGSGAAVERAPAAAVLAGRGARDPDRAPAAAPGRPARRRGRCRVARVRVRGRLLRPRRAAGGAAVRARAVPARRAADDDRAGRGAGPAERHSQRRQQRREPRRWAAGGRGAAHPRGLGRAGLRRRRRAHRGLPDGDARLHRAARRRRAQRAGPAASARRLRPGRRAALPTCARSPRRAGWSGHGGTARCGGRGVRSRGSGFCWYTVRM
ncbi:MAG: Uncharacterized MFS-type transporter, partial [uncultured Actinomycetospora sp.]